MPIIPRLIKFFDHFMVMPRWQGLHHAIMELRARRENIFFIEIGCNDGVVHDPIYEYVIDYGWEGIMIEPVQYYYDRLRENYKDHRRLVFENVAISDRDEVRAFYRIKEGLPYLPKWCEGLGSFNLDVLLKHKKVFPSIESFVVKEDVQCLSFDSLLAKHGVSRIDLLLIDTEGFDYGIIQQIDFDKIKPTLLVYEHKHLNKHEAKECRQLLKSQDYQFKQQFGNTLAYQPL